MAFSPGSSVNVTWSGIVASKLSLRRFQALSPCKAHPRTMHYGFTNRTTGGRCWDLSQTPKLPDTLHYYKAAFIFTKDHAAPIYFNTFLASTAATSDEMGEGMPFR